MPIWDKIFRRGQRQPAPAPPVQPNEVSFESFLNTLKGKPFYYKFYHLMGNEAGEAYARALAEEIFHVTRVKHTRQYNPLTEANVDAFIDQFVDTLFGIEQRKGYRLINRIVDN